MRTLLFSCLTLILLFLTSTPQLYSASEASTAFGPLRMDIHISFDLDSARMQGTARLVLPPERKLKLFFTALENVQIAIEEAELETSKENSIP
ncbi:MAG: hypothetical protein D3909_16030, partial [Candidatus Electrothrix sp. ATG1]|nr:hypothetical protein [Candidatus Electrothrix sp. ATG1]